MDEGYIETEYGIGMPVRWCDVTMTAMYDGKGQVIEVPKCEVCHMHKNMIMGKETYAWICSNGCTDE